MLFSGFELLAYWQIVKDRRYPIGFNEGALYDGSNIMIAAPSSLTPT